MDPESETKKRNVHVDANTVWPTCLQTRVRRQGLSVAALLEEEWLSAAKSRCDEDARSVDSKQRQSGKAMKTCGVPVAGRIYFFIALPSSSRSRMPD